MENTGYGTRVHYFFTRFIYYNHCHYLCVQSLEGTAAKVDKFCRAIWKHTLFDSNRNQDADFLLDIFRPSAYIDCMQHFFCP